MCCVVARVRVRSAWPEFMVPIRCPQVRATSACASHARQPPPAERATRGCARAPARDRPAAGCVMNRQPLWTAQAGHARHECMRLAPHTPANHVRATRARPPPNQTHQKLAPPGRATETAGAKRAHAPAPSLSGWNFSDFARQAFVISFTVAVEATPSITWSDSSQMVLVRGCLGGGRVARVPARNAHGSGRERPGI